MDTRAARKAVIMARGLGTRMRRQEADAALSPEQAQIAETGIKGLIPIGDRPFLDYVISGLADAGYEQVCLVVAPGREQLFARYTDPAHPPRVQVSLAVQQEPRGTADAVLSAAGFAGNDLFLVMNADNYYPVGILRALRLLGGPGLPAFDPDALVRNSNIGRERIARYALLEIADGTLRRIVEKPDAATLAAMGPNAPVSMNCWMFGPMILEACRSIAPSARGELELADAVQWAIAHGERFRVIPVAEGVLDMTSRSDVATMAERLREVDVKL